MNDNDDILYRYKDSFNRNKTAVHSYRSLVDHTEVYKLYIMAKVCPFI